MNPAAIPDEIYTIVASLKKAHASAYLVGGSVRDLLLGYNPDEYDFEIFADDFLKTKYETCKPEEQKVMREAFVAKVLEVLGNFSGIKKVGKSFGIFKMEKRPYDFSFPRAEEKTGETRRDYHIVINPFLDFQSAQKRRDITINSLLYCLHTGEIIDHFGGLRDLENRIARHVDPDTFIEDPLRVYRIAQFISRFGFIAAPETISLSQNVDFERLSKERIDMEFEKLIIGQYPEKGLKFLLESKVLEKNHPELEEMVLQTGDIFKEGYFRQLQKVQSYNEKLALFLLLLKQEKWDGFIQRAKRILYGMTAHRKMIDEILDYFYGLQLFEEYYEKKIDKAEVVWYLHRKKDAISYPLIMEQLKVDAQKNGQRVQDAKDLYRSIIDFNPIVDGGDLNEMGLEPSEKYQDYLFLACKWQLEGKNKEEILENIVLSTI